MFPRMMVTDVGRRNELDNLYILMYNENFITSEYVWITRQILNIYNCLADEEDEPLYMLPFVEISFLWI